MYLMLYLVNLNDPPPSSLRVLHLVEARYHPHLKLEDSLREQLEPALDYYLQTVLYHPDYFDSNLLEGAAVQEAENRLAVLLHS